MNNVTMKEIKEALVEIDRIGDEGQKELAMYNAGVTRRKVYEAIAAGLVAEKEEWGAGDGGKLVVVSREPDYARRERCALIAVKLFGDMVEKSSTVSEVTIKQEEKDAIGKLIREGLRNAN